MGHHWKEWVWLGSGWAWPQFWIAVTGLLHATEETLTSKNQNRLAGQREGGRGDGGRDGGREGEKEGRRGEVRYQL